MSICLTHGYYHSGGQHCPVCVTQAMNSKPLILNRVELSCPSCSAKDAELSRLRSLATRWYLADGTFETLPEEEVIRRRKEAAGVLARGNASHWYICYSEMKKAATTLWGLLDDIDTMDDAAKSDDKAYREQVRRIQAKRWDAGITTDGQTLDFGSITPTSGGKL